MNSNLKCQVCSSSKLTEILDLGHHPPSDAFLAEDALTKPEVTYPLRLFICDACHLVQLSYAVDPNILFGETYVYMSGVNTFLKKHLQSISGYLVKKFNLTDKHLAIDIGSNDGTLLEGYLPAKVKVLGVDPSSVADVAIKKGIPTIKDYFNEDLARKISNERGKAKIITATNIFAHIKELHSFVAGVKLLLDDDGVFLTESHYLLDMVTKLQYPEIYLEHLRYYSLESLINLFDHFGMSVFHAERVATHGGSIRVLACKNGAYPVSDSVKTLLDEEKKFNLNSHKTLFGFRDRVNTQRNTLMALLWSLKSKGAKIVAVPAPAKGSTLLNFCRIGPDLIDYAAEKSEKKIGKYTPGTHIIIRDESQIFKDQPDYLLLLSWDIKDILVPKLRESGYHGKIILPIPTPEII